VGGVPTDEGVFGTGPLNEGIVGVLVRAAAAGRDSSAPAGFQSVSVEARGAVTAQVYTLQRLCVDGVVRGDDGATYSAVASRAAITGQSNALVRLLTDSSIRGQDPVTGTYQPGYVELPSAISGRGTSAVFALYTAAIATGIDNTGAAVLRAVEARNPFAAEDPTLIRLHTAAWSQSYNAFTGAVQGNIGLTTDPSTGLITPLSLDARESGAAATLKGNRYSFTHQTPGTLITAQATFVATTPTLLLYNSAGNATTIILRTVRVVVLEATVAPVMICVAIDTADRFSAGGTVITGQNWSEASAIAYPGTAFRFNATATAAGAGTRYLWTDAIPTGLGGSITIGFKDGILVSGVGSILIYCWDSAGANAPDIVETVEVEAF
jgi:hypothetical protein